jgi:hypothetical protein
MATLKLTDKIKFIKKALKTPYHFFYMTADKYVCIVLENKENERFSFNGTNIYNSVITAENYVKSEIKAGTIKLDSIKSESREQKKKEDE